MIPVTNTIEEMRQLVADESRHLPGARDRVGEVLAGKHGEDARRYLCAILTANESEAQAAPMMDLKYPSVRDFPAEGDIRRDRLVVLGALYRALEIIIAWSVAEPENPERERAIKAVDRFLAEFAQVRMFAELELLAVTA